MLTRKKILLSLVVAIVATGILSACNSANVAQKGVAKKKSYHTRGVPNARSR